MPQNRFWPSQSMDWFAAEQADIVQQRIERPFLPEDFADADGADEGRQDHGHEQQGGEDFLAGKLETIRQPGEGHAERERSEGAGDREEKGIEQAFEVDRIAEDLRDVSEGERPAGRPVKSAAQGLRDREQEEQREERGRQRVDEDGEAAGHGGRAMMERGCGDA